MAGDWIKVEHSLSDKPEVHRMAEQLGVSPEQVVGHLVRVWSYADQQGKTVDDKEDVYVDIGASTLDLVARLPGFASALAEVQWIKAPARRCTFPGLQGYISESAKMRALRNRRQSKWRAKKTPPIEQVRRLKKAGAQNERAKPQVKGNGPLSDDAIKALGMKYGLQGDRGESMEKYRARVLAEDRRQHDKAISQGE